MNTCATCAHWRELDTVSDGNLRSYDVDVRDPVTFERVVPQPYEVRRCMSPKLRFVERPEIDGAALFDGSQYWAGMATGPDFGCIHHTPDPRP